MRLVDTDAVKLPEGFFEKVDNAPKFYDWLNSLPTIDAVPVVRCKECVHYKGHWYCETWNNSPGFPAVKEDVFCNMAERRTDE